MRSKSSEILVTAVLAKRRGIVSLNRTLPWGTPLRSLTVAEFATTFREHLPLVRAKVGTAPSDRVLHGICSKLSDASLYSFALLVLTKEAQQELKKKRIRVKRRISYKRRQKEEQHEDHTSSTEEERSQAEEQSDPVSTAVEFLLGLVGM